jgi:hypothetical protein
VEGSIIMFCIPGGGLDQMYKIIVRSKFTY